MANHGMNKYPNIISNSSVNQYVDPYVPYYKDKEVTYWSMNLEKSNFYRSHTQGSNAFARSSGFTQPIHNTKSANQYNGNVSNNQEAKYVYTNDLDDKFVNNYRDATTRKGQSVDLIPAIKEKILTVCRKNGWTGMRKLRIFLRNLTKKKSDKISRGNLKYFLAEFGIVLSDEKIANIYKLFDVDCKDEINFMDFFDSFEDNSELRGNVIQEFLLQHQTDNQVSFKSIEKNVNFNFHPEVISFRKTADTVLHEFVTTWDNLKENNLIFIDNFRKYFKDISLSVETDDDFIQILRCCGYK